MKIVILFAASLFISMITVAQSYPEPEFSKEVYYLKKDGGLSAIRLEKGVSKMENKTKLGGFGGSESAYVLEGGHSSVRFPGGSHLSFVISNGQAEGSTSTKQSDSIMMANGIDPSLMQGLTKMNDPSGTTVLYKLEQSNGNRKVLLQKNPGMSPFGSKKQKSSDKYSFSVKKIREGYWELVIDKSLPKGEYAFTMSGMGQVDMDGSTALFAFGIE